MSILCLISVVLCSTYGFSFYNQVKIDSLVVLFKILFLLFSIFFCSIAPDYCIKNKILHFEYPFIFGFFSVGNLVLISASNLVFFFIALEVQNMCLYVLISLYNNSTLKPMEAALKYFVMSAVFSLVFMFGSSFLYLCFGTLDLYSIYVQGINNKLLFTLGGSFFSSWFFVCFIFFLT